MLEALMVASMIKVLRTAALSFSLRRSFHFTPAGRSVMILSRVKIKKDEQFHGRPGGVEYLTSI